MSRTLGFRCDLLDYDLNKKVEIRMLPGGEVTQDTSADIKRTARFRIEDDPAIQWESDLFRLSVVIDKQDVFPLGIFVPSSSPRTKPYNQYIREVSAYDRSLILAEDKLYNRYLVASGQTYTSAVHDLITGAGITQHDMDLDDEVLPVEREYGAGISRMDIINELLDEINYQSLYADAQGHMVAQRYTAPGERLPTHVYRADQYSIIRPGLITSMDFWGIPNVFVATVSSPELPSMRAEYVNVDPNSLLSTIRRQRRIVAEPIVVNSSPSQGALQAYIERRATEASQVFEEVSFSTAINPVHGTNDIIELHHPAVGVQRYVETAWTIPLEAGRDMTHTARRVVTV